MISSFASSGRKLDDASLSSASRASFAFVSSDLCQDVAAKLDAPYSPSRVPIFVAPDEFDPGVPLSPLLFRKISFAKLEEGIGGKYPASETGGKYPPGSSILLASDAAEFIFIPKNPPGLPCTGAPTAGLMNGLTPPPGRPQNAPGLIATPGENVLRTWAACIWGVLTLCILFDGDPGCPWGEGCGRKLNGGIDGVIGGRPCGVMEG
jgi:hypothetical protein